MQFIKAGSRPTLKAGGYLFILGYLYKSWDLEGVKLRELNYTVTTHQAIPYTSNNVNMILFI